MKKNKTFLVVIGILLILAMLFVKPLEGFSWNPSLEQQTANNINMDYPGNDIGRSIIINPEQCATKCRKNPRCVGIITKGTPGNSTPAECWLKSKFENATPSLVHHPFFLTV